ncbi:MAG: hypothetical protein JSU06_00515 [Actinobacteria bacterium]|nr:hypothetical protein [Actinomycetota bacterium]
MAAGPGVRPSRGDDGDPDALIAAAKEWWSPLRTVCLLSGGTDSGVLAHRCREHYDELLYIDTGTAIPGVEVQALGFRRVITYTLATEPGSSVRAAGFEAIGRVPRKSWDVPSRPRRDRHRLCERRCWGRAA